MSMYSCTTIELWFEKSCKIRVLLMIKSIFLLLDASTESRQNSVINIYILFFLKKSKHFLDFDRNQSRRKMQVA